MSTGIYIIFSKTKPERQYVGSAVDFVARRMLHISNLVHGCHHNQIMQNHFNKYEIYDFVFAILEECEREELISKEQKWIDFLQPYFNINPIAGSRLDSKHSAGTKIKMQDAAKSRITSRKRDIMRGRFIK